VTVVNGPELKSRWVGESEENLRQVFVRARQAAPALIVFDELDSFAAARGTFTGSGVEHSMVNQLLTEMDGFRENEMVFIVGTTNFVESLDPALLRPGRFEFHLEIPYPGADDRRAVLGIYDAKLGLKMQEAAMDHAVRQSGHLTPTGTRYSGDHLQALCRTIARLRLRAQRSDETTALDVDQALDETFERPELNAHERLVVATHEAGHAVVALHCEHVPPIERISIKGDVAGALGFVSYLDPANRHVVTRRQLLDSICVLFGGREAELALLDDLSVGSAHDLERATATARALVERFGMAPEGVAVRCFEGEDVKLSDGTRTRVDEAVRMVLDEQRARAQSIVREHRASVQTLRDLLVEHEVLDRHRLAQSLSGVSHG
jgi:cell division protease FtsH